MVLKHHREIIPERNRIIMEKKARENICAISQTQFKNVAQTNGLLYATSIKSCLYEFLVI